MVTVMDDLRMEISDIRRENLRTLMKQRFDGRQARLADALGKSANYISRCLSTAQSSAGSKNIGEDFAREIEQKLGLERYQLDQKDMQLVAKVEGNAEYFGEFSVWDDDTPLDDDEVYVPFLKEVELSAGNGKTVVEPSNKQKLRFGKMTLRRQNVQPSEAVCVSVSGNSMEPVLPHGSTVGVDQGCTTVTDGKMYALNHGGQLRVKTLYRAPGGGIRMRSYNIEEHPDEVYTAEEMLQKDIIVIGKVFWYSVLL
ncbi:helix-turn-helix transcriptional regulator [Pseudomonas sp. lyk4-R2A-10]|uniref:S24 family peptidase n=1 Tax=Pseudomonas sp. lyk4-R2A-10 TaxID=3040315 RepID=UPI0025574102|nr:helix-turn-helix transcriptional regulator [Pseudomonas sp. lyk4-R2A-10]